jgi:hypothetical protein
MHNIPYTTIHIGANAKLISSTLENYNSLGGAIDIGAIFLTKEMTLMGLVIRNIGTQFTTYSEVREKLPLEVMGVSQELEHVPLRWHLTLENLQQWNVAFQIRGNCRLMELRLRKNIICKYRFATCYFELFLKKIL